MESHGNGHRTWTVPSVRFGAPAYDLHGADFQSAVLSGLSRIARDILAPEEFSALPADVRVEGRVSWKQDVLDGLGGAEVTLLVSEDSDQEPRICWIPAAPAEVGRGFSFGPSPVDLSSELQVAQDGVAPRRPWPR